MGVPIQSSLVYVPCRSGSPQGVFAVKTLAGAVLTAGAGGAVFGAAGDGAICAGPVWPAIEFDTTKPVKLSGILTKVEWSNPHIWIYLDVKDDKGNVTNWGFSASPPGMLQRRGITKGSLKLGEVLTISGHRAKDGSNNASGNVVIFADGHDALIGQDQALNPTEAAPGAGRKQ